MRFASLIVVGVIAWPAGAGAQDTAGPARAVLERHCASCHGGPDHGPRASRGGFDRVLDPRGLVADGLVVPGEPDRSELYQRLAAGEMPPSAVTRRPSAAEVAAVRAWIAAGAPAVAVPTVAAGDSVAALMAAELARLGPGATSARFVSLDHLPPDQRDRAAHAVGKLLNSLSWRQRLRAPVAIAGGRLLRIDLRWYGWSVERWERLARASPQLAVSRDRAATRARRLSGSLAPVVAADWLVWAGSQPALYHELLELPADLAVLESRLRPADDAVRAGFNGSGVSQHNRLIERRSTAGGGYLWVSFDFAGGGGRRNLFEHPTDFTHDGGEVIFSLPNGLQGYMLVDSRGRRIDSAPTQIVVDRRRSDSAVQNGVSCMGCHQQGIIPKRDQLRAHVVANGRAFGRSRPGVAGRVLALHPPAAELAEIMARDRRQFRRALAGLGPEPAAESIDATARTYEREVDLPRALAELGVGESALRSLLRRPPGQLGRGLGALLVPGGTVEREVWDSRLPELIRRLGRGRPLADVSDDERRALGCSGAASGARCYAVADRFLRGRGVAPDLILAYRLYRESCRRGLATGCTAVGLLAESGRGTARSPATARQSYARGCAGGDGRGCERWGRALLGGSGGPRDSRAARSALGRACRRGRPRACATLGGLQFHGIGGPRALAAALGSYRRGCAGGAGAACRDAGYLYRDGLGVARNPLVAARYFAQACAHGDAGGCRRAGDAAYRGRGVRRDQPLAAGYFERGCAGGDGESCRRLAVQYRWGKGVTIDWVRSERLFRRACELGVKRACAYL